MKSVSAVVRFYIKHITVVLFFTDTKIVAQVETHTPRIRLAQTTGTNRALVENKAILIGKEHIAHIERNSEFFIKELAIDINVEGTKRTQLIKLLLAL